MVIETGQWQWTWRSGSDVRHILQIRGGGLAGGLDGTDAQNRDEVSGLRRQEECDVIFVFRLLLAAATRKSYFSMNVCFCKFPICIHLLRTDNLQLFLWSSLRLLWGDYNQIELRAPCCTCDTEAPRSSGNCQKPPGGRGHIQGLCQLWLGRPRPPPARRTSSPPWSCSINAPGHGRGASLLLGYLWGGCPAVFLTVVRK